MYVISFPRNHFVRTKYVIRSFRSLEIISFERNMLFRSLEISFAILDPLGLGRNYFVPSKSFRLNEICYLFPRNVIRHHEIYHIIIYYQQHISYIYHIYIYQGIIYPTKVV